MIRPRPLAFAWFLASSSALAEDGITVRGTTAPPKTASDTTVDKKTLEAAPHRTASDLLVTVPGFSVSQHGGEGKAHQIFFRGFDAVHGQDVELWAGGAPVNDVSNVHGQGYADLHFLPPELVLRVRATPGAYDVRQGDFAVAGTVRFDLGLDHEGAFAKVSRGSFGTSRLFLGYRPKGAGEETFAAFEAYETSGFGPSRAATRVSGTAQGTYALGDFAEARVLASTYAGRFESAGVVLFRDVETRKIDRFATYDPKQGGASTRSQLVVELRSQTPGEASRWSITPYVVLRSMTLRQNYTGYLDDPQDGDSLQQLHRATTVGATAGHVFPARVFSARDALEIGVATRTDVFRQGQNRLASTDDRVTKAEVDAKGRVTTVGGFVEHVSRPHGRVTLRLGLRTDGVATTVEDQGIARSAQGTHFGKKALGAVRLADGLVASVAYGEGFRSPQARSVSEGERTPFTTVTSYEAGLRYGDKKLGASLAGFRTSLSDDLVFDQSTGRNERVPGTARTGVAFEGSARPTSRLVTNVSFTYTRAVFREGDARVTEGSLLPYVPQVVARTDFSYRPHLGTVAGKPLEGRIGWGLSHLGRRPMLYGEFGHDVTLVDTTAGLALDRVELGADVYNALDARWFDGEFTFASRWDPAVQPTLTPTRHVTMGPPRTVLVTLTLRTGD